MDVHRQERQVRQDVARVIFASICIVGSGLAAFVQKPRKPSVGKLASVIQLGEAIVIGRRGAGRR